MELDLDALEALEKKATQGPWEWDGRTVDDGGYVYIPQGAFLGNTLVMLADTYEGCGYDCDLLAALRNAFPELLRRLREAERVMGLAADALEASEGYIQPVLFSKDEGAKLAIELRNKAMSAIDDFTKERA